MIEQRLLARLRERANARGIVPVRGDVLGQEVGASQNEVGAALEKCERAGLLRIIAPFPFLVVKLHSWSGTSSKARESARKSYSYSYPVITHKSYSYSAAERKLLDEILETLGESDSQAFEGAIRNFSADVIRKSLDRVRRARSLRKNRTALFRYLLTKLS